MQAFVEITTLEDVLSLYLIDETRCVPNTFMPKDHSLLSII